MTLENGVKKPTRTVVSRSSSLEQGQGRYNCCPSKVHFRSNVKRFYAMNAIESVKLGPVQDQKMNLIRIKLI